MPLMTARLALALALVGGWSAPLAAQSTDLSRDRTGANAGKLESGDFADPAELPDLAPEVPDAPLPTSTGAGLVTIGDIAIETRGEGAVVPPGGWMPAGVGEDVGLALSYQQGEALDAGWIARQYRENGLVGAQVGVERLVALAQLINRAFLSGGYVNSGVLFRGVTPAGVLQLELINGHLAAAVGSETPITVQWRDGKSGGLRESYIRSRLSRTANAPFNATELEREFRLLASDPAIRAIDADLQPGARPGEALLSVTVSPAPRADVYASFANSRSPAVGGERIALGGSFRNLLLGGDIVSAEVGWTEGEPDYYLEYAAPLGSGGTGMFIRGGENKAAVVDPILLPLNISSEEWNIEGGLTQRLIDEPLTPGEEPGEWISSQRLTVGLSLARRVSKTFLFGVPFSFAPGSVDGRSAYTAMRLTGDWLQRGVDSVVAVSLTGTLGLEGTRSNIPGIPSPKENFAIGVAQASYAQRLTQSGLEFRARVVGQLSNSLLYPGEKLSLGGAYSVRGYRENLLLADQGFIGSLELLHPFDLFEDSGSRDFRPGAFLFGVFVDSALGRNRVLADPRPEELLSVGAQLSWVPSDAIEISATYAEALIDPVGIVNRDLQDRGISFRITIRPLRF